MDAAGTVGALFGTPLAAALPMSEPPPGKPETPLWAKLFVPPLAASAGAPTTVALSGQTLHMKVSGYPVIAGPVVALVGAGLGLPVVHAFPYAHAAFHRIPHPVLMVTAGGVVLGGEVSMCKG